MKTYYVLVQSSFCVTKGNKRTYEKLGYVKIDLSQYLGNFRDYCHDYAIKQVENYFRIGSVTVGKITTKPLKKLKVLNDVDRN